MITKQKTFNSLDDEVIFEIGPDFIDNRGYIMNILETPIKQVAIIYSKKGTIRGNHYHPKQVQYIYVIRGKIRSYNINLKTKKRTSRLIKQGDLVMTYPRVAHVYKFLEDTFFLNLVPGTRNKNKKRRDTIPYHIK